MRIPKKIVVSMFRMKSPILLMSAVVATITGLTPGFSRAAASEHRQAEMPDTSLAAASPDSSSNAHHDIKSIAVALPVGARQ